MSTEYELILPGPSVLQMDEKRERIREARIAAKKAKLEADFDAFTAMRKYVIENMHKLRGRYVPMEVDSIQLLEDRNALILNDLQMVSFSEANDMIGEVGVNQPRSFKSWKTCLEMIDLAESRKILDVIEAAMANTSPTPYHDKIANLLTALRDQAS